MNKGLIITLSVVLLLVVGVLGCLEMSAKKTYLANHTELNSDFYALYKDQNKVKKVIKLGYKIYEPTKYENIKKQVMLPRLFNVYDGKKPGSIVVLGGSYPYSLVLEDYQTFAYKLNKLTERTSYDRSLPSTGSSFIYKQLSDKKIKNELNNPEYFIYVYRYDDIHSMFNTYISPYVPYLNINYKIKDNKLVEVKHNGGLLYSSYVMRNKLEKKSQKDRAIETEEGFPLFNKTIEESVNEMKAKFPNAKFVIVRVSDTWPNIPEFNLDKETLSKFEKNGVIYLDAEKLLGHKITNEYRLGDHDIPNERFWDELSLALKRKFDL